MTKSVLLGICGIIAGSALIAMPFVVTPKLGTSPGTRVRAVGLGVIAIGWGLMKFIDPKKTGKDQ